MDISLCEGGKCSIKNSCKRFLSKPSPIQQSYFDTPPFVKTKSKLKSVICEFYWEIDKN